MVFNKYRKSDTCDFEVALSPNEKARERLSLCYD